MAEKSLFFNAFEDENSATGYDRNYNADDISDWQAAFFDTGVVKTDVEENEPQGLKVVAAGGLNVNVKVGRAAIKGKGYINTSLKILTAETGESSARYDMIVLRYNNVQNTASTSRKISIEYKKGTSTVPTVASLQRNNNVYELLLAYLYIGANSSTIGGIYDKRGDKDLCPWFTPVKGYEDYYDAIIQHYESVVNMATSGTTVITNLSSKLYNEKYSLIEVYTNGIKEPQNAYTIGLSGGYIVITFTAQKAAGAKITANLDNFIDGEGMSTALSQYTKLVQDVANLKTAGEYNYICNGVNDNVKLSEIAQAWLNGGTDYGSRTIKIHGTFGATNAYGGDGTSVSPYSWLRVGTAEKTNRKIIFDFTNCGELVFPIASGTYNSIFFGVNAHIVGANVTVNQNGVGTIVRMFSSYLGSVYAENCRFWITSYQDSVVGYTGTFINCRGSVANVINNSYCFVPSTNGVVKVIGGEYYSYTGDSTKQSAIVGQSGADAVSILYGVSAPTLARSGFYQTNSILQFAGGGMINCTDLISELPMVVVSGSSNIRGTIAKSKTNVW